MSVAMGDLNTHLGRDAVKYSFHESRNNNGKLVHDFVEQTRFSSPAQLSRKSFGRFGYKWYDVRYKWYQITCCLKDCQQKMKKLIAQLRVIQYLQ